MLRDCLKQGLLITALLLTSKAALADEYTAIPPDFVAPSESLAEMQAQLYTLQSVNWYSMTPSEQRRFIRFSMYGLTRSQRNETIWRGLDGYDVGWNTLSPDTQRKILMDVLSYRILITERNPAAR